MAEQTRPTPKDRKGLAREGRRTARRRKELRDLQDSQAQQLEQEGNWSSGQRFMIEKVHKFFQECGGVERGFITRDDMQKLEEQFSFSPEELDVVFTKLDLDGNGRLTPEELTRGLSHFLTDQKQPEDEPLPQNVSESLYQSQSLQHQVEVEDEEKQHFAALMDRLGANAILQDNLEVWKLWVQLRRSEPNLLGNLEDFLCKVTAQIQESESEKADLEHMLKKRMAEHNTDVQRLSEEMELQINKEKQRMENENIVKLHTQSQDLQKELDSKQEEVQQLAQTRAQLEAELVSLRRKQDEAITENQSLKLTNQELETRLQQIQQEFQEAQDRLVSQQEEAAQRQEKEGERDQLPSSEGLRSSEADPQKEARQGWGSETSQEDIRSEGLQRKWENTGHTSRIISIEEEPLPLQAQEDSETQSSRVTGQEVDMRTVKDGDAIFEEKAEVLLSEGAAGITEELEAELVSLRRKQDEAITENQTLKLTNQELETRLQQIQQEFQGAQDRLVSQQEEAAQRQEKEGERDQSPGSEGRRSDEADPQLEAELVSLRRKQDEAITENQTLKLTNQELETRLQQIQQEFQEAQDRLVSQQEEAAQRQEKEGERDQSPGSEGRRSDEADPQLEVELVSLRRKQDEAITENQTLKLTNQELETQLQQIQQELQEAQDRLVSQQEEAAQRQEKEGERDQSPGSEGRRSDEADPQLEAELVSLRRKQDEAITENQTLKLTNQELETRLQQIQQELQEAQDRLVSQQEEAAQRQEKEGERDQSPGSEGRRSDEADPQLEAELVSLRRKQDEAITENQTLKLTNQELETRLQQIQQELQEAQDRLVSQQEEAAQRQEKEGKRDQSPGSEGRRSDEADPQLEAELVSLRRKQDEAITENQTLKLTNQELETRLQQIQQELQEAQDRLVSQQEEAAQRQEKEGERDQSPGSEGRRSDEADPQLEAELVSLRRKQDEAITENQSLKLTNQELETRLQQIQQELQEAQDRLVSQQEEAAQRQEKEGERDQSPGSEGRRSDEADPQLEAELVSLRRKQDEAITENQTLKLTNQELETRLQQIQQEFQEAQDRLVSQQEEAAQRQEKEGLLRTRSIRRRVTRKTPQGEDLGLPHLRVEGQDVTMATSDDVDGACEETETTSARDGAAETIRELEAELVSLRRKQDEAITENQTLKLTNQELETRLQQIQQEFQEAQDRLVSQQEEAAQRQEKEGERDQSPGSEGRRSDEADPQLEAELVSLRRKQDEAITENQTLKLTNQELETRLQQIQQEFQEAQDRLVSQQEEAAQRQEKEGLLRTRSIRRRVTRKTPQGEDLGLPHLRVEGQDVTMATSDDVDGACEETETTSARDGAAETYRELEAELVSLRRKQDEAITENQALKLTNQELETRLQQIQQEFQEAQDRLVSQQEEAAQRQEKEGLQRTRSIRRRVTHNTSSKAVPQGEDLGLPHLRVEGQDVIMVTSDDVDGACEEKETTSARDGAAETIRELEAELVSLRRKQDEAITENQTLKLTNQELETRLQQIQQELQEAQDRLVSQQEEAAQRQEKEGLQRTRSIRRRVTHNTSGQAASQGEAPGLLHLKVEGQDVTTATGDYEAGSNKDPDHLYNIMFVGNAYAGKTSFIQRFCDNNFEPGISSTVGIDYQVKTLTVDNRHIALQLWDTAGQERFHSVTKQFFRKADGVIVMYDITSPSSFTQVRYWLTCIKEIAADDVSILLLGNKMDDDSQRQVSTAEGEQLAQENNILFYECSACTGHNINTPMVHLARSLRHQEEKIKKTVEIVEQPAKKGRCCT
ncbi:uncharacterized protein LOC144511918 [Mustelus asterias]